MERRLLWTAPANKRKGAFGATKEKGKSFVNFSLTNTPRLEKGKEFGAVSAHPAINGHDDEKKGGRETPGIGAPRGRLRRKGEKLALDRPRN